MNKQCPGCGDGHFSELVVREMMFGFREPFQYGRCVSCGTLSLSNPPADLTRFYPEHYYSFANGEADFRRPEGLVRRWLHDMRSSAEILGKPTAGRIVAKVWPGHRNWESARFLKPVSGLSQRSRIIDVGCGNGKFLRELECAGFQNLLGIDPFIAEDIVYSSVLRIEKCELSFLPDAYCDLLMMHHVLEHIADPEAAISEAARVVKRGGTALICIPLADSDPSNEYNPDWVELDAPRHFTLFSRRGFESLIGRSEFKLSSTVFDSGAFSYWGSELYARDISLVDESTQVFRQPESFFSADQLRQFSLRATRANETGTAGRAAFYLVRK